MSSNDPFGEPADDGRTVIRPVPGRGPAAPPQTAAPPPAPPNAGEVFETVAMGNNPLVAAAAPLLQLLARLRNTLNQPDPGGLRERTMHELRRFEERAREAGVPPELVVPAHYALCASLDDVVLNAPWGRTGIWDASSLVSTFHHEVRSGERFYDRLAQTSQSPGRYMPVIELMYLCMSLGFEGKYRLSPRGPAELDRVREDTYALIVRQRQAVERGLSPHWTGVSAPYRGARATVPVWVVASVGLAILAALVFWFRMTLGEASAQIAERANEKTAPMQMPQIVRPPPIEAQAPTPPPPAPVDRLCTLLENKLDKNLVSFECTPGTPVVRLHNRGMFASGSATVEPRFIPLLKQIGAVLKNEPGRVHVIGYTDNRPIHTLRFPSNFQLSVARAEAAAAILADAIGDPRRLSAEGRGEADPIASNATAQGREENRRIEIVLYRSD